MRKKRSPRTAPGVRATCEAFRFTEIWTAYEALPLPVRKLADANYELLKRDPRHPSLQFKKVGRYWSVRVGLRYRAPGAAYEALPLMRTLARDRHARLGCADYRCTDDYQRGLSMMDKDRRCIFKPFPRANYAVAGFILTVALLAAPERCWAGTSVEPMNDASNVFPAIGQLIQNAQSHVHLAIWGFDDELKFSADSQVPTLKSRQNIDFAGPPPVRDSDVENLHCGTTPSKGTTPSNIFTPQTLDGTASIALLRCKASALVRAQESNPRLTPAERDLQRSDVKVLVWNNLFDDPFNNNAVGQRAGTNVDDLAYIWVKTATVLTDWSVDPALRAGMRERGSGESMKVLRDFQKGYKALLTGKNAPPAPEFLPMPTGIDVLSASNLAANFPFASHHQKLVTTEQGAYVGGLNFLKEYWDKPDHDPNFSQRYSSGGLASTLNIDETSWLVQLGIQFGLPDLGRLKIPSFTEIFTGTLHDTGAIIRGDLTANINELFADRWISALHQGQGLLADFSRLPESGKDALRPRLTTYGRLKQVMHGLFPNGLNTAELQDMDKIIDGLNTGARSTAVSRSLSSQPDPKFLTPDAKLFVSAPQDSYIPSVNPSDIRVNYDKAIDGILPGVSSFFYLENQFFQDHDIFKHLFAVCVNKPVPFWCDRDGYGIAVAPYQPQGLGAPGLDEASIKGTVKEEMQNLVWLEVKTAHRVLDRATGYTIITGTTPPPNNCARACPAVQPFVHFKKLPANPPAVVVQPDDEPSAVETSTIVEMMGDIAPPRQVDCALAPGDPPIMRACPVQPPQPIEKRVSEIITDGAFMSYALVRVGVPPPTLLATPLQTYAATLSSWSIYIHSKHSEFINGSARTFIIGSANINPRSLSFLAPLKQTDAPDSESAIFWTPENLQFAGTLWREHMGPVKGPNGADVNPVPPDNFQQWVDQGWSNWRLIRAGNGPSSPTQRVVRLDAVERCFSGRGCP